jgi:hypothetical protein
MGIFFYRPSRGLQLVFSESFEYPNWEQTFDVNNLPSPAFSGSAIFAESFEYPNWEQTFDVNNLPSPAFSGSVIYTEDFDSSWDDT